MPEMCFSTFITIESKFSVLSEENLSYMRIVKNIQCEILGDPEKNTWV